MAGQVVTDWRRQVVMYRQRREHFCQPEQTEAGACQKTRQVFVGDLLIKAKTVVSLCLHCSPLLKWPEKGIESDGLDGRAGDGTRTRDSLLGRQELYRLSYSRREIPSHARGRSGCADSNRGPHGPKPCALPTALHPAIQAFVVERRTHAHYSTLLVMLSSP